MSVLPVVARRRAPAFPPIGRGRLTATWPSGLLVGAALLVAALMLITPLYLLIRAFGAENAVYELLARPSTVATLGRTVWLAAAVTAASAALALPLAWLTVCTDLPGRRFWSVATALPLVLPSYVAAYLLASSLGPRGLLQQWLGVAEWPTFYGFPAAFLALTLMSYPFTMLTVRAALRRMDPALAEAARSLGHSPWQTFWRVTMPQLRPSLLAGSLLVALYVLRDFGAVTMLRYDTFTRIIYIQYQSFAARSQAAVLSVVLLALTAGLLALEMRSRGRARYDRQGLGAPRKTAPVKLGRWRWPALLFMTAVVLIALVLPAAGLLHWLLRAATPTIVGGSLWAAAGNSFTVAAGTAVAALLAAAPVAILAVRRPGRLAKVVERLTYAGFALPGLVIALAFVFLGARYAPALYQTLPWLLLAYVVLFVPQAVGATRASLLQVPPSLEEAGRSLGHSSAGVFRRVTLPLVRPGLLAGGGLVFLTAMKELPAALILSPLGFRTLSTAVWANISEAFFAQAAAPTLLLILLSSIPLAILTLRDK